MLKSYSDEHEQQMRAFYSSLSEKHRRRYAAFEARKLPYGGISYLCRVLGCDHKTISRSLAEVDENARLKEERDISNKAAAYFAKHSR